MDFWELFDYLCEKKRVSKRRACEDMGFSPSLAAKAKHAGTQPKTDFVFACSKYFGVTVAYLLGEEETPTVADDPDNTRQIIFENYGQRVLFDTSKGLSSSELLEWASRIEKWKEDKNIDS